MENRSEAEKGVRKMFVGKNVHYSPADGKPLCSYSQKLCKQRRLNGFAFCIRHVLEDPNCGFKQCAYEAKYNGNQCTNPIPEKEERIYCNSHLQVLGLLPKKSRKKKPVENPPAEPPLVQRPSGPPLQNPRRAPAPIQRAGSVPLRPHPLAPATRSYGNNYDDRPLLPSPRQYQAKDVRRNTPPVVAVPKASCSYFRARRAIRSKPSDSLAPTRELNLKLREERKKAGRDDLLTFGFSISDDDELLDSDHDEQLHIYNDLHSCLRPTVFSPTRNSDIDGEDVPIDRHCKASLSNEEGETKEIDVINADGETNASDDDQKMFRDRCQKTCQRLRQELRRLRHISNLRCRAGKEKDVVVQSLMATVRSSCDAATEVLTRNRRTWSHLRRWRRRAHQKKKHCSVLTGSGKYCGEEPVPFSRYCPSHISGDAHQHLFADNVNWWRTPWAEAFVQYAPSLQSLTVPRVDFYSPPTANMKVRQERKPPLVLPGRGAATSKARILPAQPKYERPTGVRSIRGGRGAHTGSTIAMLPPNRRPAHPEPSARGARRGSAVGRGLANRRQNVPIAPRGRGGRRGAKLSAPPRASNAHPSPVKAAEPLPRLILKLPRQEPATQTRAMSPSSSDSFTSGSGSESGSDSDSGSGSGSSSSYTGSDMETNEVPSYNIYGQLRPPANRSSGRERSIYSPNQHQHPSFYSDVGSSMWPSSTPGPLHSPSGMVSDRSILSSPFVSPTSQLPVSDFPDNHDHSSDLMSPQFSTNHIGSSPYLTMMPQPSGPGSISPSFERGPPGVFSSPHSFSHSHNHVL